MIIARWWCAWLAILAVTLLAGCSSRGYGGTSLGASYFNLYAPNSTRIGYGSVTSSGTVNLYAPNGRRLGTGKR